MATEWTAATTGLSAFSIASMTVSRFGSAKVLGVLNSLMSAPPEKALPAPVITIALTAASARAFFTPSKMPLRVACPRPLTGGLFMVMTAMTPLTS